MQFQLLKKAMRQSGREIQALIIVKLCYTSNNTRWIAKLTNSEYVHEGLKKKNNLVDTLFVVINMKVLENIFCSSKPLKT